MHLISMSESAIITAIEQQDWLEPIEESTQSAVLGAFDSAGEAGQVVKEALHGTKWLGHPLHPVITDVPVGSWTAALVLDILEMTSGDAYSAGADAAVAIGLVSAVGAAATGIAEWSGTKAGARRLGIVHGLTNSATALLYGGSYWARKAGNRGLGRTLAFIGFASLSAGAYLGGALSYELGVGVKR